MRAIIFANGDLCSSLNDLALTGEELVVAADGGCMHCQALGLLPDALIGDLDSTPDDLLEEWKNQGVKIIQHPHRKDETDLELALLYAQERGAREIIVYGAVGGRLDMTFGNLMLLAHPDLQIPATLICGRQEVQILRPGDTLEITGIVGDTVSLLALLPGSSGIRTTNLEYPLNDEALGFGTTRGISNRLTGEQASIRLEQGLLAVIHTRNAG